MLYEEMGMLSAAEVTRNAVENVRAERHKQGRHLTVSCGVTPTALYWLAVAPRARPTTCQTGPR